MSELFPCPNPACTNWIPVGRDKCFRCGHTLSTDAAQARIDADPESRHPLLVPGLIAGVLLLAAGGWWFSNWQSIRNDKTPPVVSIVKPTSDDVHTASGRVDIEGTVTDKNLDRVEVDGKVVEVLDGRFRVSIETGTEAREIRVVAHDKAGNVSNPAMRRVVHDTEAPSITSLTPASGTVAVTRTITISGTASETLAATSVGSTEGAVDGTSFSTDVTLAPGPNTLRVQVSDLAGNPAVQTIEVRLEERALPAGVAPAPGGGFVAEKDGSRLVIIGEGTFQMGNASGDADERPVHAVKVSAFMMDQDLVTVRQWRAYMDATGASAPPAPDFARDYYTNDANGDLPAVNVSWQDAKDYAEWVGRRLPTEAEWELAARGTEARAYPWGNDPPGGTPARANVQGAADGHEFTSPVGAFPDGATPEGLRDMAGNAWQWTLDFYDPGFYGRSPGENPEGPETGTQFTLRGGAFTSSPADVRSTNRYARAPDDRARNVGFRTVADFP